MKTNEIKNMIPIDDVDDVIGIAAEMMATEEDMLSDNDLKDIGSELDIPAEYIERARKKLKEDRRKTEILKRKEKSRKKMFLGGGIAVSTLFALLFGVSISGKVATLNDQFAAVESTRSQVQNVLERQQAIESRLKKRPDSADKDAELSGAENRIRVEKMRLNSAVAEYNKLTRGLLGKLAIAFSGLPSEVK